MRSNDTGMNMKLAGGAAAVPILVNLFVIVGGIVGGAAVAYLTWTHAPAVGGEWWPYIRVLAAFVAFVVGGKVSAIVSFLAAGVLGVVAAVVLAVFGR